MLTKLVILVSTFNKEKALEGAFSEKCEIREGSSTPLLLTILRFSSYISSARGKVVQPSPSSTPRKNWPTQQHSLNFDNLCRFSVAEGVIYIL